MTPTESRANHATSLDQVRLLHAKHADEYAAAHALFRQYAAFLQVDLCFQGFEQELADIDLMYGAAQRGALLLAYHEAQAIGATAQDHRVYCGAVGLRQLDAQTCEMKRMYVRPEYQGHGIGKALCLGFIETAKQLGYQRIRLDSVRRLDTAIQLYRQLGFVEISAYRHNPFEGAIYMQKELYAD